MKAITKIFSVSAAAAMTAAVMTSAVSAAEFEGSANVAGYLFEMVEWQKKTTEPVVVDHYGTYTVSIDGLSVDADMIGSFYLKDYDFETNFSLEDSNLPTDLVINTLSVKVNGNEYTPADGYATTNESGKFEVCYVNFWGDSFLDLTSEGTIKSFEITFEVAPADGSSYEDNYAQDAPAAKETPAEQDASDTEKSVDNNKTSPDTGVEGIGAAAAAALISAAALIVCRKKK